MRFKRICTLILCLLILLVGASPCSAAALSYSSLPEGSYYIQGTLSCYINAMGGVEFGGPMLTGIMVNCAADGSKTMTLLLQKSSVTIYSVTCDTFIDVNPSYMTETNGVPSGTIGWYKADGELQTEHIHYTLSQDTAENAAGEAVHYVESITFPLTREQDSYHLTLYINSNVMGTQFTLEGYPATVTVDWSTLSEHQPVTEPTEPTPPEPDAPSGDVEAMDGLHIYRPEEKPGQTENPTEQKIIAYFHVPLLIWTGIFGIAIMVAGVALIIWGKKEKQE